MYKKSQCWPGIAQNPQLQQLDELASAVFNILRPSLDELQTTLDERRHGAALTCAELVGVLNPYLFDEKVRLHVLLSTELAVFDAVRRLFAECSSGRKAVAWDTFREYLCEAHSRHFERVSQRRIDRWKRGPQEFPNGNLRHAAAVGMDHRILALREGDHRRFVDVLVASPSGWAADEAATEVFDSAMHGFPTSFAVIDETHHLAFSVVDNNGSSLLWLDSFGKSIDCFSTTAHTTYMTWIPQIQRLACGSSLGEVTLWSSLRRRDIDVCNAHNSPVVGLGFLELSGCIETAGSDGKLVLLDPATMTRVRSYVADEPFRCATFSSTFNLAAAGGSSSTPIVMNASLPPRTKHLLLEDLRNPHEYVIVDMLFCGEQLLSLDGKGIVKYWDVRTLRCIDTVSLALQRDTVMEKLIALSPTAVVVSGSCTTVLEVDDQVHSTLNITADREPLVGISSVGASKIVTASSESVKLWSWRTGENIGGFTRFHKSSISCICVVDASTTFTGHNDGVVCRLELAAVSAVQCFARHESPVTHISVADGLLVSFDAKGNCFVSFADRAAMYLVVENILHSRRMGQVLVPAFARHCFTAMNDIGHLIIIEVSSDDDTPPAGRQTETQLVIDDVRQYDLVHAFRHGLTHCAYALLDSLNLCCAADGSALSIISVHSGKAKRVLSWPSYQSDPTDVAYIPNAEKPLIVTVEEGGLCVIYNVATAFRQLKHRPDCFLDVSIYAPSVICSFATLKSPQHDVACSRILLSTYTIVTATKQLSCAVYRLDGVKVGDLDMFRAGAAAWIPVRAAKRGSTVGFNVDDGNILDEVKKTRCKHPLALVSDHPIVGGGSPPRSSSQMKFRMKQPGPVTLKDIQEGALHAQVEHSSDGVVAVPRETSTRTLEPIDVSSSKWTLDDEPKKKRDSSKTMVHMRLLTQEMNPSREVILMAQRQQRVQFPTPSPVPQPMKKVLRLQPLRLVGGTSGDEQRNIFGGTPPPPPPAA